MGKPRKPGDYAVRGRGITEPVVKVGTHSPGVPSSVDADKTPVQPIMINMPSPKGTKIDIWHLIAAIVVAVVFSTAVSVLISIAFRNETLDKIDKVDGRIDHMDNQIRSLDTKTTRIEARLENER